VGRIDTEGYGCLAVHTDRVTSLAFLPYFLPGGWTPRLDDDLDLASADEGVLSRGSHGAMRISRVGILASCSNNCPTFAEDAKMLDYLV